ncbi:MAG: hypothetical protein V2G42_04835 [bacterium JZ-2024 1]
MNESAWTCEKVEHYLQESWALKANRGTLRDILAHLTACPNHAPSAIEDIRLAMLLLEDRESIAVPQVLRDKVRALTPMAGKRTPQLWHAWSVRLALALTAFIFVWGLFGRPKPATQSDLRLMEPHTFEESFFASGPESDETLGLWVEASYTAP